MIKIQGIAKAFKGKQVLHSIDDVFERGKVNMIIGSSGTGKSVLIKCVVGLFVPDSGSVIYDGRDFTHSDESVRTEIRREVGMLFQSSALFDSKSVEQNVMFPLDVLTKMPQEDKLDRVNFCLEKVGLAGVNSKMPSELSGGMKKRVGIARAMVNNPRYLLCDEPNSGLDPQTAIVIDELIQKITKDFDMTTLVVSHDMNSVIGIGEKITFLYQGQKLWGGYREEIMESGVPELNDFLFSNKIMQALKASGGALLPR